MADGTTKKPVLLLPGDQPRDAAKLVFGEAYDYRSWYVGDPNAGGKPLSNGSLRTLAGRRVDVWPRADREALIAGEVIPVLRELLRHGCQVRVVAIKPDDEMLDPETAMILDRSPEEVKSYARARIQVISTETDLPAPVTRGTPRSRPDGSPSKGTQHDDDGSVFISWERLGLERNSGGIPHPNLANVQKIFANHPDLIGKIWYDEFHGKIFQELFQEGPAEWAEHHDTRMAIWIQNNIRMPKVGHQLIQRVIDDYAYLTIRNEVREWMDSLTWDKQERLPTLMTDVFGAAQNDYTAAVGRCWLVAMAARTYQPGCKMDNMPVFEGSQGRGKSSALAIIGGKWFAEMHEDMTTKDFKQNLPGKLLIEISELHSFNRAEVNRIKGIVSCPVDRYRPSYGRRASDFPRRGVWAGTTNRDDWVADDTGARRFWPIACTDINLEYLRQVREQLFAEAVIRYRAGEPWWDIDPLLAKVEQDQRREDDPWTDTVVNFALQRPRVSIAEVLGEALQMPVVQRTKTEQMRVASILKLAGFVKIDGWLGGGKAKYWIRSAVQK